LILARDSTAFCRTGRNPWRTLGDPLQRCGEIIAEAGTQMKTHVLNPNTRRYVWNEIWLSDRYSERSERMQRALKRAAAFDLKGLLAPKSYVLDVDPPLGIGGVEVIKTFAQQLAQSRPPPDRASTTIVRAKRNSESNRWLLLATFS
jgi:hypothetical protein